MKKSYMMMAVVAGLLLAAGAAVGAGKLEYPQEKIPSDTSRLPTTPWSGCSCSARHSLPACCGSNVTVLMGHGRR